MPRAKMGSTLLGVAFGLFGSKRTPKGWLITTLNDNCLRLWSQDCKSITHRPPDGIKIHKIKLVPPLFPDDQINPADTLRCRGTSLKEISRDIEEPKAGT